MPGLGSLGAQAEGGMKASTSRGAAGFPRLWENTKNRGSRTTSRNVGRGGASARGTGSLRVGASVGGPPWGGGLRVQEAPCAGPPLGVQEAGAQAPRRRPLQPGPPAEGHPLRRPLLGAPLARCLRPRVSSSGGYGGRASKQKQTPPPCKLAFLALAHVQYPLFLWFLTHCRGCWSGARRARGEAPGGAQSLLRFCSSPSPLLHVRKAPSFTSVLTLLLPF